MRAEVQADVKAAHAGHLKIGDDERREFFASELQGFITICRLEHGKASFGKAISEHETDVVFIVGEQDGGG